jgi:hypothetical protein
MLSKHKLIHINKYIALVLQQDKSYIPLKGIEAY